MSEQNLDGAIRKTNIGGNNPQHSITKEDKTISTDLHEEMNFRTYLKTKDIFSMLKYMRENELFCNGGSINEVIVFKQMKSVITSLALADDDVVEYIIGPNEKENGIRNFIKTERIIEELTGMRDRRSFVSGAYVTQEDAYIQMTGLIVKLAMEE